MGFFSGTVELSLEEIKATTTTKRCPLGTRGVTSDGRRFAYALAGGNLPIAQLVQTAPMDKLSVTAQTVNASTEDATATWASYRVSATWSTWTAATQLANEYADGWFVVEKSSHSLAAGQQVKIASNTAASSTDTAGYIDIVFAENDRLQKGLDTGATIQVIRNEYYAVVAYEGINTQVGSIVGVPACAIASGYYGWVQTWGPCVVLNDGTVVLGENVVATTSTGLGAVGPINVMTSTFLAGATADGGAAAFTNLVNNLRPKLGYALGPAAGDTDYGLFFLTIRP